VAEAASEAALAASCALVADASSGVGRWGFLTGGAAHNNDNVDVDDPDEVLPSAATGARDEPCGTRLTAFGGGRGGGGAIPLGEDAILCERAAGAASRAVAISAAAALALDADRLGGVPDRLLGGGRQRWGRQRRRGRGRGPWRPRR
jgi:hypothetical protein